MRKMRSSQVSSYRRPKVGGCEITATLRKCSGLSLDILRVTLRVFGLSEPPSITKGVFVWHKVRCYPFWPALVSALCILSFGIKS